MNGGNRLPPNDSRAESFSRRADIARLADTVCVRLQIWMPSSLILGLSPSLRIGRVAGLVVRSPGTRFMGLLRTTVRLSENKTIENTLKPTNADDNDQGFEQT